MVDIIEKIKTRLSSILYKETSPAILIPRQRNITFLYDPKEDLIIAVSCHEQAIKLMREFLQFNMQRTFLFATVSRSSFVPRDDFMFYSVSSKDFEWEDPEGYCLNPEVVYTRKSDKSAIMTIMKNVETLKKARYLMEKCHTLIYLERYKATVNNYKRMVKEAYPDNEDVQVMIARQYEHDEEIINTEEYAHTYKSCVDIPQFSSNLNDI